jgi:hypothetical protein
VTPPRGDLTRRDAIKLGTAALAVSLGVGDLACARPGAPAAAGRFLTADELALLDELSELIIPTDEHSPGARAAGVAAFIDGQLADAFEEKDRTDWRDGLKAIERVSQQLHGKAFMQASADQRVAVLTRVSQNERKAEAPEEKFFVELKSRVVHAYYSSEIGIKQEMEYKGNVFLQEFVGTDVSHG